MPFIWADNIASRKSNLILNFPTDPHYHLKAQWKEKISIAEISCKLGEVCDSMRVCFLITRLQLSTMLLLLHSTAIYLKSSLVCCFGVQSIQKYWTRPTQCAVLFCFWVFATTLLSVSYRSTSISRILHLQWWKKWKLRLRWSVKNRPNACWTRFRSTAK